MPQQPDIGITTTIPIEIVYAGGGVPVDLNNIFITHPQRFHFALEAEKEGLPRTICGWNKGVLVAALTHGLRRVIEVVQGDCSSADLLGQILEDKGIEVIPFSYPFGKDAVVLRQEMEKLARHLGTSLASAERVWESFRPIRDLLAEVDRLTWEEGRVTGGENHLYLVTGSDMNGDPAAFREEVAVFLERAGRRPGGGEGVRLGYVGVPSMIDNLYDRIEELGGRVVFNEVQRQFSMCRPAGTLLEQYLDYTYPYSVFRRIEDIRREIDRRQIQGLVHYVQSFCFHHLEDQIIRQELPLPVLTLEADRPGPLSPRDEIRLENFLRLIAGGEGRRMISEDTSSRLRLGLDLGSRWVKLVLMRDQDVVYREKYDTIEFYRKFGRHRSDGLRLSLERLLDELGGQTGMSLDIDRLPLRVTGYGRNLAAFASSRTVPELQAHVDGARHQLHLKDFTLLDIGGQDTKVVLVRDGRISDFYMNDRCAAGGGRYLENMARILGLSVQEIGQYHHRPTRLSATCATFGESEVVGRIVEGVPMEEICAGINYTVFQRVLPDLVRMPSELLVLTGGVAYNAAVRTFLERETAFARILVPPDPQFNGAIGAVCGDEA